MLNLRNPTLVAQTKRSSLISTQAMTYPNLTFVEPGAYAYSQDTESSFPADEDMELDAEGNERSRQGNARKMYEYLAKGSVKRMPPFVARWFSRDD